MATSQQTYGQAPLFPHYPIAAGAALVSVVTTPREAEIDLVRAMAAGDSGPALQRFYERFAGVTMAVLVRILGSSAEAEEMLQEVFLELWRRAPEYNPQRAAVSTWVVTVARSRGIDALRARQRRGGDRHQPVEDTPMRAPAEHQPDAQMALSERQQAVRGALAGLSDLQREALEMSYFQGLSHSEIAAELGVPIGTVKSRIIAGMKVLREALASHTGGRA